MQTYPYADKGSLFRAIERTLGIFRRSVEVEDGAKIEDLLHNAAPPDPSCGNFARRWSLRATKNLPRGAPRFVPATKSDSCRQ
jgi:hypothetical protein